MDLTRLNAESDEKFRPLLDLRADVEDKYKETTSGFEEICKWVASVRDEVNHIKEWCNVPAKEKGVQSGGQ